ncbi:hypothetical protein LKO27_13450 [Tessaracoccus sp. OS52]|uniref:hypothetical protein n=1 Tax=Tessaracoccus sp. OS52 TaxID=2886691 RepID=UPI001D119A4C|nr:hypothetical protein [Tessaracoccus sp. OS52]MCC2594409.1 hypothetical protein [Tessaracoccus sp. OS52]
MRKKFPVPTGLSALITAQGGMFTVAQASALGATHSVLARWRKERRWYRVGQDLWSVNENPTWDGWAWGGVLLAGDGAALGGLAAAHLWGFAPEPEVIDVWGAKKSRQRPGGRWRFRRGKRLGLGEPAKVCREQAVLELCSEAQDEDEVVGHITTALANTPMTAGSLQGFASNTRTQPYRSLILDVLAEHRTGVHSPLERRYVHDVEKPHGLPAGQRQQSHSAGTQTDVSYEEYLVLVELDGKAHHKGLVAHADMARDNRHELMGLRTLRYGWKALLSPCQVAREIGQALQRGGWTGSVSKCARCKRVPD